MHEKVQGIEGSFMSSEANMKNSLENTVHWVSLAKISKSWQNWMLISHLMVIISILYSS